MGPEGRDRASLVDLNGGRDFMSWASKLMKPYCIEDGKHFHLKDFDPADIQPWAKALVKQRVEDLLLKGIASPRRGVAIPQQNPDAHS